MLSRKLLYHPTRTWVERLVRGRWQKEKLRVADGTRLVGLVRPPLTERQQTADAEPGESANSEPPAKGDILPVPWVVFFGGNAMGLDAAQAVLGITAGPAQWGLACFAYRGYDGSEGKPRQTALLGDAREIATHLGARHGVAPASLVLMGQSLGTGVAVDLGVHLTRRQTPPGAVILLSPYTSMAQVFDDHVPLVPVRRLISEAYRSDRIAAELRCPVLLIHGGRDSIISSDHSQSLQKQIGNHARLLLLPEREHNDLWDDRRCTLAIRELITGTFGE